MAAIYKGSCLCGEITFDITFKNNGEFDSFYLCHCHYCQKDTGSAHAANLFTTPEKISWLTGKQQIKTFNLPSTRHVKSFCSNCGSAVPALEGDGRLLAVPAGSLNDTIKVKPTAHIFMASRASWDETLETIPRFDELP